MEELPGSGEGLEERTTGLIPVLWHVEVCLPDGLSEQVLCLVHELLIDDQAVDGIGKNAYS